jgi:dihydroorotase
MYDIVIKDGRVIDTAQELDGIMDIAVNGQKISAVSSSISASEGKQIIDAKGRIVTPGLIDMHCHIFDSIHDISIEPDVAGVQQGVTTVADGGSTGHATFKAFPKYIIPPSKTTVFCFLHLSSLGQLLTPELSDWREVDLDATREIVTVYRGLIKGIKLRLVGKLAASEGPKVIKMTKDLARSLGLPVMVHIGDSQKQVPANLTSALLDELEKGDILTHVFTSKQGGIIDQNEIVLPQVKRALERGVIAEVAHGRNNLNYDVARKSMSQGIKPTVLSTDINIGCLNGPVFGQTVLMAKFMALGLSLQEVIKMSTISPAIALDIQKAKGTLKKGMDADISIFELKTGKWNLKDSDDNSLIVTSMLNPYITLKLGQVIPAQPAAWPQPID